MFVHDIWSACVADSCAACGNRKFRSIRREMLYKNRCSQNFGNFSRQHCYSSTLIKLRNEGLYFN